MILWALAAALPALAAEPVTRDFPASGLKGLQLRVSAGIVAVARADTDKVQVQVTPKRFARACGITVEVKGDQVLVHAREKRKTYYGLSWGQDSCEADVTVRMPQHLELDAATGSATLAAFGIHAKVAFRSGSGSLRLRDCSGPLEASVGSGTIEAEGLTASARAKSGNGGIRLVFLEAPAEGAVRANTGSGDIEIALPARTRAATAARSGSGTISNSISDDPKSALHVIAKSSSGNITLH